MKKGIGVTLNLIWIVLVICFTVSECKEVTSSFLWSTRDSCICKNETNLYMTQNQLDKGYVFCLDEQSRVTSIADTDDIIKNAFIVGMKDYNSDIYCLLETKQKIGQQAIYEYYIVKYKSDLTPDGCSIPFMLKDGNEISGFYVNKRMAQITTLSEDGSLAELYEINMEDCKISVDNANQDNEVNTATVTLKAVKSEVCAENRFFINAEYEDDDFFVRMDNGEGISNFIPDEETTARINQIYFPFCQQMIFESGIILKNLLLMFAGLFVLILITGLLNHKNRVSYLVVWMEGVLIILIASGTIFIYQCQVNIVRENTDRYTRLYLEDFVKNNQTGINEITGIEDFYNSDSYKELSNYLYNYIRLAGTSEFFYDVCLVSTDDLTVVCSASGRNCETIEQLYTATSKLVVKKAAEGQGFVSSELLLDRENFGVCAIATEKIKPKYVALAIVKEGYGFLERQDLLREDIKVAVICFVIGSFLCMITLLLQNKDIRKIRDAMIRLSQGDSDIEKPSVYGQDMEAMWNGLIEADKVVKKANYSKYQILEAYYRFAPKQIEKILLKSSITDVREGDTKETEGNMAVVSMDRMQIDAEDAVTVMNVFLSYIEKRQKEQQGIIVANNSDLTKMKLLFMKQEGNSCRFAIDLLHDVMDAPFLRNTSVFILLYDSQFVYGVAGTDTQSFTFLRSAEQSGVESNIDWLRSMQLRLVVTESIVERECENNAIRYIGYVKKADSNDTIKLYEVLDACPERERIAKISSREKFAGALDLFYQHDFYLARSMFSEVLREAPEDRIAKWYVFTCEEYLNSENPEDIHCNLEYKRR